MKISKPDLSGFDWDAEPEVEKGEVKERERHGKFKIMDKLRLKRNPDTTFLVEMIFSNGTSREWVIQSKEETFKYRGRTYHLRFQDSKFNLTHRDYKLYYHEDYFEPIGNKIHMIEDSKAPENKRKAFFSLTPHNAKPILKMEYVKALASAVELTKWLKFILIMQVISLLIVGAMFYFIYRMTGGGV